MVVEVAERCPDANLLLGFLDGALGAQQRLQLERHLDRCEACRSVMVQLVEDATEASGFPTEATTGFPSRTLGSVTAPDAGPVGSGPPDALLSPGTQVDHFEVRRLIGWGGMGQVYLARDQRLGRKVALKLIRRHHLTSAELVQRFLFEARATAKFNHPHIIAIHDVGQYQGQPYVALEYLEGQTLRARIREGPISPREAARLALPVAEALREAHRLRLLHLDLKPSNILIPKDGRVRVLDFGLAEAMAADVDPRSAANTRSDAAEARESRPARAGTPAYMAPERWRGDPPGTATDIWALGLVLVEMLHGEHPCRGLALDQLQRVVGAEEPLALPFRPGQLPADLQRLVRRCLDKDPGQRPGAAQVVEGLEQVIGARHHAPLGEGRGPFRGLAPFCEMDAEFFHGRDLEVAAVIERLREAPSLVVVGPSGVGKSSLVRAGVIPRLQEQGSWLTLTVRPGDAPYLALAARLLGDPGTLGSLSRISRDRAPDPLQEVLDAVDPPGLGSAHAALGPDEQRARLVRYLQHSPASLSLLLRRLAQQTGGRCLLVVDQLEELFTLVQSSALRQSFLHLLWDTADDPLEPVRVVLTIRDDFLYRLSEALNAEDLPASLVLLRPLGEEQLAQVIARPLERAGYRFDDPGLVSEIVTAVRDEPAGLPLLQFLARHLWDRRDRERRVIRRSVYDDAGGVAGVLAHHADAVMHNFSPAEHALVRRLLQRLVTPQGTRKTVPREELVEGLPAVAETVLDQLVRRRLLAVRRQFAGDTPRLELVHESLIEHWGQLSRWLEQGREDLRLLDELDQAAKLWQRRGERMSEVWQGGALEEARRMVARDAVDLPAHVQRYLWAAERRRRRRTWRSRGLVLAAFGTLAVVALVLAVSERQAQHQRSAAEQRQRQAEARRAEAQREGARAALLQGRLLEARAKLRASLETRDSSMARVLWWELTKHPLLWVRKLGQAVYEVQFAPDGESVAVSTHGGAIAIVDAQTGAVQRWLRGQTDQVATLAFSPGGSTLASGSWNGEVWLWDLTHGAPPLQLQLRHQYTPRLGFISERGPLVIGAVPSELSLWELGGARRLRRLSLPIGGVRAMRVSSRGRWVATGGRGGAVQLLDTRSWRVVRRMEGAGPLVIALDFSPDGSQLAAGSTDGVVRLYSTSTGELERQLSGSRVKLEEVRWRPDGAQLATTAHDGVVRVWDLATGGGSWVLGRQGVVAGGASYSPDSARLVTGAYDGTVRMWRVDRRVTRRQRGGHRNSVTAVVASSDGSWLASCAYDSTLRRWDTASGDMTWLVHTPHPLRTIRVSSDDKLIAAVGSDGSVALYDAATGAEVRSLGRWSDRMFGLALDRAGRWLAAAGAGRVVRVWALPSGRLLHQLRGHHDTVTSLAFTDDGRLLASSGVDGEVRLWRMPGGGPGPTLTGLTGRAYSLGFVAGSHTLVVGSSEGTIYSWDGRGALRTLRHQPGRIYGVSLSYDGRWLASASSDGAARVWQPGAASERVLRGHRSEVNGVTFVGNRSLLASASDDGTVRLWDVATGMPAWRAPLMLSRPARALTHRGWVALGQGGPRTSAAPDTAWARAVAQRARRASVARGGPLLCFVGGQGAVELWDRAADRRLGDARGEGVTRVVALAAGCLAQDARGLLLLGRSGRDRRVARGVVGALVQEGSGALAAVGRRLLRLDAQSRQLGELELDLGVTAAARVGPRMAVGYRDGAIELRRADGEQDRSVVLLGLPGAAATRLVPGPLDTLAIGFRDGSVGLWALSSGRRLLLRRLHGEVWHLGFDGGALVAGTELGQVARWDLSPISEDYCTVLRQVWRDVPVVWHGGAAVRRPPPAGHRCRRGAGR